MSVLVIGMVVFFGVHSVSIFADGWRSVMVTRLGANAWRGLFSVASLVGFALIVWGYGLARQAPVLIYQPPVLFRPLALLLLLPVFPLLIAANLPGRIRERAGHPMLLATKLWALAHLLVNGMLADLVLFGAFLIWAGLDRASLKHRKPRSNLTLPEAPYNDLIAVVGGILLYGLFVIWAHGWLIGVALLG